MPKSALPLPVLTDAQVAIIEGSYFEPADVLLKLVWPDKDLDQRSIEWKAVRGVLARLGEAPKVKPGSSTLPRPSQTPGTLSDSQKEFIAANYENANNPTELTRTLFGNDKLAPMSAETKLVAAYIRVLDPDYRKEDELAEELHYAPPKTTSLLIGRLNRFGIGLRPDGRKIGDGGTTVQEQRQVEALLRYLRRPAFKVEADGFSKRIDREVFEEMFMSLTWDKPDLTPEYQIQYIQLASVTVRCNQSKRTMAKLTERFDESLDDPTKPLSKNEVDALKNTASKVAEMMGQMNALIKTLQGERAKQVNERIAGSASMHPLVNAWKTKQGRERQLALARKYNDELKGEVSRLAGMDALKCELFGLSPDSIIL